MPAPADGAGTEPIMQEQQRNLFIAFILSGIILFGWNMMFGKRPRSEEAHV